MEKSVEIVFVPAPWITHFIPTMEFGKLLVRRDDRIRVTVLVMEPMYRAREVHQYIESFSHSETRIRFVHLPPLDPSERVEPLTVDSHASIVRQALAEIVSTRAVAGLVMDLACLVMIDWAGEFGLPFYIFLPISAACVSLMLHLPNQALSESDPELTIPGFANSVPPLVLPSWFLHKNRGHGSYEAFSKCDRRFREARGIVVNSFLELQPYAFSCLSDDRSGQNPSPRVYGVGPVMNLAARAHQVGDRASHDKLMRWLDDQPPASVVFLCFGSYEGFGAPQTKEIALALERGGFRFLWTIHEPPRATDMLPEGFMERINGRGMICEWAPQAEVLAHAAIGGFVSHCGWNSLLESLWSGVPIATWPLGSEQRLNAFLMVKEFGGLAVELRLNSKSGGDLVPADEIERAVRRLMEDDGEVKHKVKEMGTIARKALMDGGSSFVSLGRLIEDITGNDDI